MTRNKSRFAWAHFLCIASCAFAVIPLAVQAAPENMDSQLSSQDFRTPPIETTLESSGPEELLSLDFENTDIRDVIRVLARKSGISMIVGQDVQATVTLQLKGITWQRALDIILKTYNLTYKMDADLIRIMTYDQMRLEEEKVPLTTKIITLDFASVDEIQASVANILSSRGNIQVSTRTNSIIITDLPEKIVEIERITAQLDTKTPQIMIEALMADVKLTNEDNRGFQWTFTGPDSDAVAGGTGEWTLYQTLAYTGGSSAAITFGKTLFGAWDLDGLINMWKSDSRVNILANPRVMTLDNITAQIEITEQIPYTQQTTTDQGAVATTSFKDAGIKLFVTPHVTTKENYITMNVKVEHSFRSGFTADNQPIIDKRKAETNLMVKDGETIVIGGLRNKQDTITLDKVPLLGDLPFFGFLFTRKTKTLTDSDLLIFVTPRMVPEPRLTAKEQARFEEIDECEKRATNSLKARYSDDASATQAAPCPAGAQQTRQTETSMPPSSVSAEKAESEKQIPCINGEKFILRPPN